MTGKYFRSVLCSDERANVFGRIRKLEHVVSADVWHFGGGAFNFGIILDDGRQLTLGTPAEMLGQQVVVPAIPPAGGSWAVMVVRPVEGDKEWADMPTVLPELVDDEGLVKVIEELT